MDLNGIAAGVLYFFAKRINFIVSVEHDKNWYDKVKASLKKEGLLSKTEYKLIEPVDRKEISKIPCKYWKESELIGSHLKL